LALGHSVLDAIQDATDAAPARIPRFDKTRDDRCPPNDWEVLHEPPDVILLEGWCVGARPTEPWTQPLNPREARDDPKGTWAQWSNHALRTDYQNFFDRLDALIMIKIPSMDAVRAGRWRQEERAWKAAGASAQKTSHPGLMTRAEVDDYVALFERLTTAMLTRMPAYADILIEQDAHFRQDIVRIPTHPA